MAPDYDPQNVFARILRGEIACARVFENDHALAFPDLRPQAPVHVLVIPKGAYVDLQDFSSRASAEEQAGFFAAIAGTCVAIDVAGGFRAIANAGPHAHQEVPHFHVHLLAGRPLGPLLARTDP